MAISITTRSAAGLATAALLLAGCATKQFGRMESTPLTGMSCEQLAAEQAEVDQFRADIDDADDFDVNSATAFLLDLGIGNRLDKQRALETADEREANIAFARRAQGCPTPAEANPA